MTDQEAKVLDSEDNASKQMDDDDDDDEIGSDDAVDDDDKSSDDEDTEDGDDAEEVTSHNYVILVSIDFVISNMIESARQVSQKTVSSCSVII